jgi:hypothetical protein
MQVIQQENQQGNMQESVDGWTAGQNNHHHPSETVCFSPEQIFPHRYK